MEFIIQSPILINLILKKKKKEGGIKKVQESKSLDLTLHSHEDSQQIDIIQWDLPVVLLLEKATLSTPNRHVDCNNSVFARYQ